jgi:hypothetical protein
MANTDSSEVVATYIYNKLNDPTNKANLAVSSVWYGDQQLLPTTPAVCVVPGEKRREFQGATFRTLNDIQTYVLVYFGKIQDIQANLHSAMQLAEAIELLVHQDLLLGGNVISCLCNIIDPGVISKGGVWVMGARMTFQSVSKTTLPTQVV